MSEEDRKLAAELVEIDRQGEKVLELPYFVEADTMEGEVKK